MPYRANALRLFLILGGLAAFGAASIDMYVPALPTLARDLSVSTSSAQVTMTTYLVGLALGQILAGSLSDALGRRRPLLGGIAIFVVASAVCAASPSIYPLAIARFGQGLASAAGVVISRAIVRDLFAGVASARYFSRLVLITGLMPLLAPILGGQMLLVTSWRGIFLLLGGFGVVLLAASALWLPETLPPDRRQPGGLRETARNIRKLLQDRRFVGYALVLGLVAGSFLGYVSASSFVLQEGFGTSPQLYSVIFAASGLGVISSSQLNARIVATVPLRRVLAGGLIGVAASGVGLLAVAFGHLGLAVLVPCFIVLSCTWGFIQANGMTLAVADHAHVAGSAFALIGLLQYGFGAVVAPLVGLGGRGSAAGMAITVTSFGLCSLVVLGTLARPQAASS